MPRRQPSALYPFLMLGLVASVALLSFAIADTVLGYFQEAVAVETRHGVLAERGISVTVASAADIDPVRLAAGRYLASASSALVVFEGTPFTVEVRGRAVDLAWLDSEMKIRYLDEDRHDGALVVAPDRFQFLLMLPSGYAARENLRAGEGLVLI